VLRNRLRNSVSIAAVLMGTGAAFAGEAGDTVAAKAPVDASVFGLGQIEQVRITASPFSQAVSESIVSKEDIYKFNALTLDRALDLSTGVISGQTGGARNERLFFVRGFDRFQSPLFIDGIRIYLPQDNRTDIGFFPTGSIAQVQIDKGYVSVLSGPGAMGGAVNIVTRKPTKEFEYDASAGISLGMDGYNGYNMAGLMGTAQPKYYLQASGAVTNLDHFSLSEDFTPTLSEDGGIRAHSDNRDYSLNLKAGLTLNATDEYSISYTGNWGQKSAPLSVNEAPSSSTQKDWRWPYWDIQSLYFLSNTQVGSTAYVKTKAYYNTFRNGLFAYDDATFSTQTGLASKAFRSYYSDFSAGGSIEAGNDFGPDELKGAFFFRNDRHQEWQQIYQPAFTEPRQTDLEYTYSAAGENRFHLTDQVDLVGGISYDWRHLSQAQEFNDPNVNAKGVVTPGVWVAFPLADGDLLNGQGAIIYKYSETGHLHVNISHRGRFPTLMERFSTRFGTTLSNPSLEPEVAINYELGGGDTFFGNTRVDAAVFYSQVTDALINVPILFCDTTSTATPRNCAGVGSSGGNNGVSTSTMQTQNVGDGQYVGLEFSADSRIMDELLLGTRFTWINRTIDAQNPANPPPSPTFHLTGMPAIQAMAYATWDVTPTISITPSIQVDTDRWSNQSNNMNVFVQTGAFFLLNLEAEWQITDLVNMQIGARNLTDDNYSLTAGFPNEGRSFFINFRVHN
jgi:iron complex outermembrane recepter protein